MCSPTFSPCDTCHLISTVFEYTECMQTYQVCWCCSHHRCNTVHGSNFRCTNACTNVNRMEMLFVPNRLVATYLLKMHLNYAVNDNWCFAHPVCVLHFCPASCSVLNGSLLLLLCIVSVKLLQILRYSSQTLTTPCAITALFPVSLYLDVCSTSECIRSFPNWICLWHKRHVTSQHILHYILKIVW